ncbi:MAG: UDP-N-acetylglucosamine 2-epimerase (non-hydrolyzing) [Chloroflexi bacterium]|nr:UDP-N-acetylglucosamine 2-epimerase (non-hydrolyzing) [Chloroflexota bacterium]
MISLSNGVARTSRNTSRIVVASLYTGTTTESLICAFSSPCGSTRHYSIAVHRPGRHAPPSRPRIAGRQGGCYRWHAGHAAALRQQQGQSALVAVVLVVFGTRPEAVKLAPVISALRAIPGLTPMIAVTGQHRELLDQVLTLFAIAPDVDLALMEPDQTLADLTARVLTAVGGLLTAVRPDLVLVQGDTCSALAASLAAFFAHVPVGHVEAGLRTGDPAFPFPEELNRRVISLTSRYHFAPTATAQQALLAEGTLADRVFLTGNPVVDALHSIVDRARAAVPPPLPGRRLILVTAHRRESIGAPLAAVCQALRHIADRHPDVDLVWPVHPNPSVREPVTRLLADHPRIHLLAPLDYLTFVGYLAQATLVLTDSGGVQEEAPVLGTPVLVLRHETERPEGVQAGAARLVGTDPTVIASAADELLTDPAAHARMAQARTLYGDGQAGWRIAALCAAITGAGPWPVVSPAGAAVR